MIRRTGADAKLQSCLSMGSQVRSAIGKLTYMSPWPVGLVGIATGLQRLPAVAYQPPQQLHCASGANFFSHGSFLDVQVTGSLGPENLLHLRGGRRQPQHASALLLIKTRHEHHE